jgi:hypothetical protein
MTELLVAIRSIWVGLIATKQVHRAMLSHVRQGNSVFSSNHHNIFAVTLVKFILVEFLYAADRLVRVSNQSVWGRLLE